MNLTDQILILKEDNKKKIIVLSGNITDYDDLLIAHDLEGNEYLIDWDLASYSLEGEHGRFEYWIGDTPLKELIYQAEILKKHNLKPYAEITLEDLKEIEIELNKQDASLSI